MYPKVLSRGDVAADSLATYGLARIHNFPRSAMIPEGLCKDLELLVEQKLVRYNHFGKAKNVFCTTLGRAVCGEGKTVYS